VVAFATLAHERCAALACSRAPCERAASQPASSRRHAPWQARRPRPARLPSGQARPSAPSAAVGARSPRPPPCARSGRSAAHDTRRGSAPARTERTGMPISCWAIASSRSVTLPWTSPASSSASVETTSSAYMSVTRINASPWTRSATRCSSAAARKRPDRPPCPPRASRRPSGGTTCRARRGRDVVGGVNISGSISVASMNLLDLDHLGLLRASDSSSSVGHDDVLAGRELVALDDLLEGDLIPVDAADALCWMRPWSSAWSWLNVTFLRCTAL